MESFFHGSAGAGTWGYDSLKNFRQINPSVQRHLKLIFDFLDHRGEGEPLMVVTHVYLTLCSALVASAAGVYLHILFNVGGILTMIGCFLSIAILMNTSPSEKRKRLGYLMATAVLEGASIGPLFEVILDFDPRILVVGFVGTSLAFACFSVAAIVAKRREFLYLGGLLSAGFSLLFWLRFASYIFGPSTSMFNFELYLGLLVFLGYIVFDTQEIIERAHHGDLDYVKHALTLFTDFVAVIVRVLVIMTKNSAEKKREESRRKKRS